MQVIVFKKILQKNKVKRVISNPFQSSYKTITSPVSILYTAAQTDTLFSNLSKFLMICTCAKALIFTAFSISDSSLITSFILSVILLVNHLGVDLIVEVTAPQQE
jgi:hypothetical protein